MTVRALAVCMLAAAALMMPVREARAAHVSCAQPITADTTLDGDVTCTFPAELVIGAPDITLDLNGYTLDVRVRNQGFDGVRIVNGVIAQSVRLEGVSRNEVRAVRLDSASITLLDSDTSHFSDISTASASGSVSIFGSDDSTVTDGSRLEVDVSGMRNRVERLHDSRVNLQGSDCSVTGGDGGSITVDGLFGGSGNVVSGNHNLSQIFLSRARGNRIVGNSIFSNESAIFGDTTSDNVIRGNVITGDAVQPPFIGGIALFRSTSDVVEDNDISGPNTDPGQDESMRPAGIWVNNASGSRITGNHVSERTRGIQATGFHDGTISHNVISEVTDSGIFVYVSDRNQVTANKVTGAGEHGIEITSLSDDNRVERNYVIRSAVDGLTVMSASATGNLLARNMARSNGDDGIDVDQLGTTLSRNRAIRNFDWGIEAVEGTIDGGGNRAASNGQRAQCLNVVCRRSTAGF